MKDRYNVNFNNDRIKLFTASLALGENRMSREDFNELCTKDNYYALVHSKFITEEDGIITSTPKLRELVADRYDIHFATSCSEEHSQKVMDSLLRIVPNSVLTDFHFRTAADIERDYARDISHEETRYNDNLERIREDFQREMDERRAYYEQKIADEENLQRQALLKLDYEREIEWNLVMEHALELERPMLFPDYEIALTRSELDELIDNIRTESRSIEEEREQELYIQAIEKLESIGDYEGRITIAVECVTDKYGNAELVRHELYEEITGTTQIMI